MSERFLHPCLAAVVLAAIAAAACGRESAAGGTAAGREAVPDSAAAVQRAKAALRDEGLLSGPARVHAFTRGGTGVRVEIVPAAAQRGGGGAVHVDPALRATVQLRFQ